ncbi:MAG: ABC transporter ATP-binding protein, partial [Acidimicrobiales bacterium]
MTEILAVEGLVLRFDGVTAVDGVSFTVGAGECVALVGPNGAGKTSVLNCISGVERPSGGRIVVDGRDVAGTTAWMRAARLGVARTLQGLGLVDSLTVLDNLLLGRHRLMRTGMVAAAVRWPPARREETAHRRRCAEIATELGLDADLGRRAGELGPGARKRLELGRALAQEPRLLLLDEPFAGAGPEDTEVMVAAIRAATAGVAGLRGPNADAG